MAELIVAQTSDFGNGFVSETFGRLKTIGPKFLRAVGGKVSRRRAYQTCVCACGRILDVRVNGLRTGNTRSCGCLQGETTATRNKEHSHEYNTTHGRSHTPEYIAWQCMRSRCDNINNQDYGRYGGRGIGYCERWKKFENFFAAMGPKPTPLHSIERNDNDGNYDPGNCFWADKTTQANNRRSNRMVTIGDKTDTLANWCRYYVIAYDTVQNRLRRGWDPERALTTSVKKRLLDNP